MRNLAFRRWRRLRRTRPPAPNQYPSHLRDYEYKRLGTVSLLAGLDLHTGRVTEIVSDRHASVDFIALLGQLDAEYPARARIHVYGGEQGLLRGMKRADLFRKAVQARGEEGLVIVAVGERFDQLDSIAIVYETAWQWMSRGCWRRR